MALDGIVIRALTSELKLTAGARIHKIHQPDEHTLVLSIHGSQAKGRLLLSANPTYPRAHWTTQQQANPLEAPMFCMLMRKHCENGIIESVRQPGSERIIEFDIRKRDELGDYSHKTIVIELMGRHSNIILMDPVTRIVHDGIHHVTPAISSYRIVLPGSLYALPPTQDKADPFSIKDEQSFLQALKQEAIEPMAADAAKQLVAAFSGISPLLAKEIVYRAGTDTNSAAECWTMFKQMIEQFSAGAFTPTIVKTDDGKEYFSVTELTHLTGQSVTFKSVSECLEAYYGSRAERDTVKQRTADLYRFLQNEKAKNTKKIDKLNETLDDAKEADRHRILGELVTAYMHQIKKGDKQAEVINYYSEEQENAVIELDPQLTPSENAQRYFRRYTKAKNSLSVIGEQLEAARGEIAYFDSLLQQLDNASLQDIEEIREELAEQGYIRVRNKRGPKKKKPVRPALLCYTSSEGAAIYVGKNNTQNEYLTNRLAAQSDTWLHTKDIPGSHVVIRGSDYGNETLEEAAMLAAFYSQARGSSLVPVDYTLIRHVRKPSGAKPGFVIYDNQKTLFITPDEQRIGSLPSQVKA